MTDYFHTVYDPVAKQNVQIPFTEEEISARQTMENETSAKLIDEELIKIRKERDDRLLRCDWTQLPNAPLPEYKKQQWETYRQSLRDLPITITDVYSVIWPNPPV